MLNDTLIHLVEDKVIDTMILAEEKFRRVFDIPKISFELNSGKVAGRANFDGWLIRINPRFLVSNTEEIIKRTVPHECAHLITFKLFPFAKQAHGPEFRSVCRAIGISQETYHTMILPDASKFTYICNCRKWSISNCIHNRIKEGSRRFCRKCKGELIYLG